MELPVVNHPEYVTEINENSIFPIKKFSALAKYLLQNNIVKKFHIPKECSLETLSKSHSIEYINNIKNKTLNRKAQVRIGFPINDSVIKRSFLATGGTALAAIDLVNMFENKNIIGAGFIINLPKLKGDQKLINKGINIHSLMEF